MADPGDAFPDRGLALFALDAAYGQSPTS